MTRQVTDQLYIDLEYFTPEDYLVYIAEAESAVTATASISCDAEKIAGGVIEESSGNLELISTVVAVAGTIKDSQVTMSVTATITAMISHIEGADLFAFSEAQLALDVSVIRSYNIASSAAFSTAIDAVRGIYVSAQADAVALVDISGSRSRAAEAAANAAFSLATIAEVTRTIQSNITSQASVTVTTAQTINASASISSTSSTTVSATKPSRLLVPTVSQGGNYGGLSISSTRSKFGAASLKFDAKTFTIQNLTNVVYNGTEFVTLSGNTNQSTVWISTSTDAVTWTSAVTDIVGVEWSTGNYSYPEEISFSNGYLFTRIRNPATAAYTLWYSTDGVDWSSVAWSSGSTYYSRPEWNASLSKWVRYDISASSGFDLTGGVSTASTVNGTWTTVNPSNQFVRFAGRGIARKGSATLLVGIIWNSTFTAPRPQIRYSTNTGSTWLTQSTPASFDTVDNQFNDVATDGTTFVAVGGLGIIYTSTNGVNWTQETSGTTATLNSIEYLNGKWVVSGAGSVTLVSTDAVNWTLVAVSTNTQVSTSAVTYGAGKYISKASTSNIVKSSTDATSWTSYTADFDLPYQPAVLSFPDDVNWSSWQTIDFWAYTEGFTASSGGARYFSIGQSVSTRIQLLTGDSGTMTDGRIEVRTPASNTQVNTPRHSVNQWNHFRVVRSGIDYSIYLNGTRIKNITLSSLVDIDSPFILTSGVQNGVFYIDEVLVTDQLLTDPSAETFTVPTAAYVNSADTSLILHFDSNFEDDANQFPQTKEAAAALSGIFDDSILSVFAASASATLTSTVAVTASAEAARRYTADIASESAVSSTANRVRDGQSAIDSASTLAVNVNVVADASVALSSEFAQATDNSRTRDTAVATDSIASQLAAVAKVGDFLVTIESAAIMSATAVKTTEVDCTANANTAVTVDVIKAVDAASSLAAECSVAVNGDRIRFVESNSNSQFEQSSQINVVTDTVISLVSQAAVSAEPTGTISGAADLSSTAIQTAITDRSRQSAVEISAASEMSVAVSKFTGFESSQNSTANLSAAPGAVRPTSITTDAVASELAAVAKIGDFLVTCEVSATLVAGASIIAENEITTILLTQLAAVAVKSVTASVDLTTVSSSSIEGTTNITIDADLSSEFILTVDADRTGSAVALVMSAGTVTATVGVIKQNQANLSALAFEVTLGARSRDITANLVSTSTMSAVIGGLFNNQANLQGFAAQVTVGKIIHITADATYMIQSDYRVYTVSQENRLSTVAEENRQYTI